MGWGWPRDLSLVDRLERLSMPEPNSGCWLWIGHTVKGYGRIRVARGDWRQLRPAHRVSYEIYRGLIPVGLEPDHLCRVTCCINPWHLEAVTQAENNRRSTSPSAINRRMMVCSLGHPLVRQGQQRRCLTCANGRRRIRRAAARVGVTA